MRLSKSKIILVALVALAALTLVLDAGALADKDDDEVLYSPETEPGITHLYMYENLGAECTVCHNGTFQDEAPSIAGMKKVKMAGKKACGECHNGDKAPELFISLMDTRSPAYARCEDCHAVK